MHAGEIMVVGLDAILNSGSPDKMGDRLQKRRSSGLGMMITQFVKSWYPQRGNETDTEYTGLNDLVSEKVGGKILFSTDDWFAAAENLLLYEAPVFRATDFTEFGKWMDGWETRRKRIPGHDWCIIQLGTPGVIYGVDINTAYFTGNFPPKASIQGTSLKEDDYKHFPERVEDRIGTAASKEEFKMAAKLKSENWETLLESVDLQPGVSSTEHNYFKISSRKRFTHIRFNIHPDGGVARLRVFGQAYHEWKKFPKHEVVDLVAAANGGICVQYTNAHFGHPKNMLNPGQSIIMADGWETARRRDRPAVLEADSDGMLMIPGSEWAVFKLGHTGYIQKIEIDTHLFKGNFPDSCLLEGCMDDDCGIEPPSEDEHWQTLLPPQKLSAHKLHTYEGIDIETTGPFSHVRITIKPDGGISRLRLYGTIAP